MTDMGLCECETPRLVRAPRNQGEGIACHRRKLTVDFVVLAQAEGGLMIDEPKDDWGLFPNPAKHDLHRFLEFTYGVNFVH